MLFSMKNMNQSKYTFTLEKEIEYIEGCSKICGVVYLGDNEFVKYYGSLLSLFGEPQFSSEDFEASFDFIIKAKSDDGDELLLSAYSGPTGPAIGGPSNVDAFHPAVMQLEALIKSTAPSDYDYSGYYLDGPVWIDCGIKQGEIYYKEKPMSVKEADKIMSEFY